MAQTAEIVSEIEALAVHCRMPILDVSQRAMWIRDWCSDLAGFDIAHVRKAFREWRLSGATKFPTPGQILPLIRACEPKPEVEKSEAWRELSDAEYAALDLPEKERHHLILAKIAMDHAGPMWRHGVGALSLDEMPEQWHEWRNRAANHRAEAKRLRDLYRKSPPSQPMESYRALAQFGERPEEPVREVHLPSIAGKADEGGLTPEMRALLGREG